MTEEILFEQTRQLSASQRVTYLDRECSDPALRARVEALLAADAATYSPLDLPVVRAQSFGDPAATGSFRPAPSADEAEGAVIAGRYKLRQQIGEGGMGTVWMADQTEPVKRKVAVKLIRVEQGQSKTILARFEAERQAIALMDHPNIAKLLDAGTTATGSPFFVMELVKGIPLNEFCDQHRLTIPERLHLFMQICSAVQHAHQKGIIHRDLKPSNILVESHDGKPVPKVIDFGLAKATSGLQLTEQSMFTAFGSVMGTPLYMAPEQATFNAVDVDTRADVYALGVILYELLTGTTPITRDTLKKAALDEMLRLVREQEAPTPSSRLSSVESKPSVAASRQLEPAKLGRFVKGELDWIVMKALSKERDRRYETANGFARDIECFLNHEPVQAGPPSASYLFRKFVQRNRGQVVAVSLVLLALVVGVVGTTLGLIQASVERDRAILAEVKAEEETRKTATERDKSNLERDEKDKARILELQARRMAQDRVVRLHVRTGRVALEREEGYDALHWYGAAWLADGDNLDRDSIHRQRIGSALLQLAELQAVRIHNGILEAADLSPDGKSVISYVQGGNTVELWNAETGRLRVAALQHPAHVLDIEWSPDGRHISTRANDNIFRVWDAVTGKPVGHPLRSSKGKSLAAAALSPDGKFALLSSTGSHLLEAVSVVTGKTFKTWTLPADPVSVRISPQGDRFTCAFLDTAALWDIEKPDALATFSHRAERLVDLDNVVNPCESRMPCFSADGQRLVTLIPGSMGFTVWDGRTGNQIAMHLGNGIVNGVSLSPTGKKIVSFGNGTFVGHCTVSETDTGKRISTIIGKRNVSQATFFPDEKSILFRTAGSDVYRADVETGKTFGPSLRACGRGRLTPQVSPDGQRILLAEFDGIARLWRLRGENTWSDYDMKLGGPADGQFATQNGQIQLDQTEELMRIKTASQRIVDLVEAPRNTKSWLSPDGSRALFVDGIRAFRAWDTKTGKPVSEWFSGPCDQTYNRHAAFTPDGQYVYTLTVKGDFECWNTATWKQVGDRKIHHPGAHLRYARLSPDGRILGVTDNSNNAYLYNTERPNLAPFIIRHTGQVWALDFSADCRYLVTASGDLTARVWDLQANGRAVGPGVRLEHPFRGISFSPDAKTILTFDNIGNLQLWDWRTGDHISTFPKLPTNVYTFQWFSKDGKLVVSKPFPSNAKPYCYPIADFKNDISDLKDYLELLTSQHMDAAEAIIPLRIAQTRVRKKNYMAVWKKIHPEWNTPDPLEPEESSEATLALMPECITPLEAIQRPGEFLTVQFRVKNSSQSRDKKWYYLNSHEDYRDTDNFVAAFPNITPDKLQQLNLPEKYADIRGKTVIVRGKMGAYQGRPQLVVEDTPVKVLDP